MGPQKCDAQSRGMGDIDHLFTRVLYSAFFVINQRLICYLVVDSAHISQTSRDRYETDFIFIRPHPLHGSLQLITLPPPLCPQKDGQTGSGRKDIYTSSWNWGRRRSIFSCQKPRNLIRPTKKAWKRRKIRGGKMAD